MLADYLIVGATLALAAGYVIAVQFVLSHVERRDLAALADEQPSKAVPARERKSSTPSPNGLLART